MERLTTFINFSFHWSYTLLTKSVAVSHPLTPHFVTFGIQLIDACRCTFFTIYVFKHFRMITLWWSFHAYRTLPQNTKRYFKSLQSGTHKQKGKPHAALTAPTNWSEAAFRSWSADRQTLTGQVDRSSRRARQQQQQRCDRETIRIIEWWAMLQFKFIT